MIVEAYSGSARSKASLTSSTHVQQIIEIADDAVAAQLRPCSDDVTAVPVAQRHEGAFAGADAFEAFHAVHGIVAAFHEDVLQRIVEVILHRGFIGGIGFDMVGQRFCLADLFARDPRRQILLNAFGIIAAPPFDLFERREPVLHQAVFIDLCRSALRDNLLDARGELRRPWLRALRSLPRLPFAVAPSRS